MMRDETKKEKKSDEMYRLRRLYRYYEKQLDTCHISVYEKTLQTLNKIERRLEHAV